MHRHWQKGFTLIELLIALTIFAVLSVMIGQTYGLFATNQGRIEQQQADLLQWQRLWFWLSVDASQIVPRSSRDALGDRMSAMVANEQLQWNRLVSYPTLHQNAGIQRIGYALQGGVLYRLSFMTVDFPTGESNPDRLPLLQGVRSFRWRLLDQSNRWQTTWPPAQGNQAKQSQYTLVPKVLEVTVEHEQLGQVVRLFPMLHQRNDNE